jgi:predicted Zn-dependent protease
MLNGTIGDCIMRCKSLILATTFVVAACHARSVAADSPNDSLANDRAAYDLFQQGRHSLASGQVDRAAESLKKSCELNPASAEAQSNYGIALSALGQKDEAIAHMKKATEIEPKKGVLWMNLGIGYQSKGDLALAAGAFEQYLKLSPTATSGAKIRAWLDHYKKGEITATDHATGNDYVSSVIKPQKMTWNVDRMPIKVFVASGTETPGFKPEYADLVAPACNDWASPLQGKISFKFVNDRKNADITVDWAHDMTKAVDCEEGGQARYFGQAGHLTHVDIMLLTIDPSPTVKLTAARVSWILHHEIGHALGLVGHSPDPDDIMYYNCSPTVMAKYAELSKRDQNTIAKLYSLPN